MDVDKWANPGAMWDERFAQSEPVYGDEPNAYLRANVNRLSVGMSVLVPGDGYGRNGIWLARQGLRVHTLDLSAVGVARARNAARASGLEMTIEHADLSSWLWPESEFDAVVAIFMHLPPDLRHTIHASILRALKPGGIAILEAFTPAQSQHSSGGPKQVELLYTAEILRRDFAAAEVIELEEAVVNLNEGRMHRGSAAVVHGIFRKK